MSILDDLQWRGLIHQATDLEQTAVYLAEGVRTVYIGFDPTADSLHAGSLLPLLLLRRFQRAGHRPIALVGGATGMIGDPTGKSQERNLLSADVLRANVAGLEAQMRQFLDFDCGPRSAVLLNNFDWMHTFSYIDFLRDVGKNFPVNVMLAKDSVKSRLNREESGLSYTEFSYMLLQAYDFVHLYRHYDCRLQAGGSDQWGNITAGIDLGRRMCSATLFGITCPLLTKSDGSKMGKTEEGAIWLSPQRTSPYQFYQYWYNVADDDVENCLKLLTDLDCDEIESLRASRAAQPQLRESQTRLAAELTRLVHGEAGLASARQATGILFGAEIADMNDASLATIFADVPSCQLSREELSDQGIPLIEALVSAGLARSKGEARRLIEQGGVYINNRRADDFDRRLVPADLASESMIVLRQGKKKYALVRCQ